MSDFGHELQFGVFITPTNRAPETVVALSVLADERGLDLVTFQDHPYNAGFLDTWTLLSYVAAATSRIHLSANVLNLRLREPAVLARAVASLDLLSGGRVELGIGAGGFADAAATMGARRLTPGQGVDALEEAIDLIRALWDTSRGGPVSWTAATTAWSEPQAGLRPRTRSASGSVPSSRGCWTWSAARRMAGCPACPYLGETGLADGNRAIDRAAVDAGRHPSEVRRLLNVPGRIGSVRGGPLQGPPSQWVEELTAFAVEDGVSTFILIGDDATAITRFAAEIAPGVREAVAAVRAAGGRAPDRGWSPWPRPAGLTTPPATASALGVTPTPDSGRRFSPTPVWDESTRPQAPASTPGTVYTDQGRAVSRHLIEVHDSLRSELDRLRDVLTQVRDGAAGAADARAELDAMTLRQNDWTLGAYCARYCTFVTGHHGLEDASILPHLAASDPALEPVIRRLTEEHVVIHAAIEDVDAALVAHLADPADHAPIQAAIDRLSDALLSHLAYEEQQLVEPLARFGFTAGQVR